MIRPLRQVHRLVWPLASVTLLVVLLMATRQASQHPMPLAQSAAQSAADPTGPVLQIGKAQFELSVSSSHSDIVLRASPIDIKRTSTGRVAVFLVSASAGAPRYLGSLAALRTGLAVNTDTDGPLTLRFYDQARERWLGEPLMVAVTR